MHALPIPVHQQTDFTLKPVVILRLQDTFAKFCTRAKLCSGTTTRMNCAGAKVALESCKHPLTVSNTSISICSLLQYFLVISIGNLEVKLLG